MIPQPKRGGALAVREWGDFANTLNAFWLLDCRQSVCLLALVTFLAWACSSTKVEAVNPAIVTTYFSYLQEGKTSRQQAVDHLGPPRKEYENGRIVTYLLKENANGELSPINFREKGALFYLVLSFGSDDILVRYTLVRFQ
jgi:hypothetical protein